MPESPNQLEGTQRPPARRHDRARALLLVGMLVFIAALVLFAPVAWELIEQEWAPPPSTRELIEQEYARPASTPDWIVVARTRFVVRNNTRIDSCLTYTAPGGPQQTCHAIDYRDSDSTPQQREYMRCWNQARIGDPLPDCWR